jgi:hypothetical protein
MKRRKHSFDFDGIRFINEYNDGEPKIFKSIEALQKAKEKGREKLWVYILVIIFIGIMLISIAKTPKPSFPPDGETEAEYKARTDYVKEQLRQRAAR